MLAVWREQLRDQIEHGILKDDPYLLSEIKGNLNVITHLQGLDYEGLVSLLGDE